VLFSSCLVSLECTLGQTSVRSLLAWASVSYCHYLHMAEGSCQGFAAPARHPLCPGQPCMLNPGTHQTDANWMWWRLACPVCTIDMSSCLPNSTSQPFHAKHSTCKSYQRRWSLHCSFYLQPARGLSSQGLMPPMTHWCCESSACWIATAEVVYALSDPGICYTAW